MINQMNKGLEVDLEAEMKVPLKYDGFVNRANLHSKLEAALESSNLILKNQQNKMDMMDLAVKLANLTEEEKLARLEWFEEQQKKSRMTQHQIDIQM